MADLVPPTPQATFNSPREQFTWREWFKKMAKNINEFATSITNILTQITAVNSVASATATGVTLTAATTATTGDVTVTNITTSGYSTTVIGHLNIAVATTTATPSYVYINYAVKRDSTLLLSRQPLQPFTVSGASWLVDVMLPVVVLDDAPPSSGSHDYKINLSLSFFDAAGAAKAITGSYSYTFYLAVRENKT